MAYNLSKKQMTQKLFLIKYEVKWSEVTQSCPTLCNPVDCSPPGSTVHGILQARILEWVTISFSRGSSWPRDRTQVPHIGGRHFYLWATIMIYMYVYIRIYMILYNPHYSTSCWLLNLNNSSSIIYFHTYLSLLLTTT